MWAGSGLALQERCSTTHHSTSRIHTPQVSFFFFFFTYRIQHTLSVEIFLLHYGFFLLHYRIQHSAMHRHM
jgi:hypothetical protein